MLARKNKVIPIVLMSVGSFMLASVIFPLFLSTLQYKFFTPPDLIDPTAVSGHPAPRIINVLGISTNDLSQASSWFETAPSLPAPINTAIKFYTLSIPRVGMLDVPIEVNGSNLKKNAIHFPGSAMPGTFGNSIIFGHSAIPQFYTKDNPLTIFNPIIKTKVGDLVTAKFDGVTYTYLIKETKEVTPDQVSVMSQRYDRRELTLITCVPLGTYWRRFIAHAELVN